MVADRAAARAQLRPKSPAADSAKAKSASDLGRRTPTKPRARQRRCGRKSTKAGFPTPARALSSPSRARTSRENPRSSWGLTCPTPANRPPKRYANKRSLGRKEIWSATFTRTSRPPRTNPSKSPISCPPQAIGPDILSVRAYLLSEPIASKVKSIGARAANRGAPKSLWR